MLHDNQKQSLLLVAFVLNLFFIFIHGQPQPTLYNKIDSIDLAALREIKNSLTEIPTATSEFFSSWDFASPDPCSTFAGLICSSSPNLKRVISLTLGTGLSDSPGLAGSLSPAISNLTELAQLVLFSGIVTGSIPYQLGNLANLRVISLTHNRLTGPVPPSICRLANLHTLDLSYNQLTGPLPNCIAGLKSLKVMIMSFNRINGHLPPLPAELLHLDLKNNGFTGTLPYPMPFTLRYLSASMNRMWGPLNGLESLSELVYLDLSMNGFNGPIPSSLFRSSLSSMLIQRNNLSGGVPLPPPSWTPGVDSYGPGSIIDLSHNILSGELTAILLGVESLFLNNNHFTGTVPKEYVQGLIQGTTSTLYLQHNYFTEFPFGFGFTLPDSVSLCLTYNCLRPPPLGVGVTACPASAGEQLIRPAYQCSGFNNGSSSMG